MLALGRSRFDDFRTRNILDPTSSALRDLPSVEEELRQIHRRIGGLSALNERATEAFLYEHLGEARLIHLASHSFVDPFLPLYSRVELWDSPDDENDGTLYLYELQGYPLAADLVVLSGCSTARGLARSGEGMMGLQYAFRAAGARSVLATLWQVEDRATVDLMDEFYLNLRRGLSRGDALRQAQLTYLDSHEGRSASPFFWAAPVLYGDVSPIPLKAPAPSAVVWILVGVLLVLSGLALPRLFHRRSEHA
jgi:CHAT domain-containing protein